jgi:hypothetical protein
MPRADAIKFPAWVPQDAREAVTTLYQLLPPAESQAATRLDHECRYMLQRIATRDSMEEVWAQLRQFNNLPPSSLVTLSYLIWHSTRRFPQTPKTDSKPFPDQRAIEAQRTLGAIRALDPSIRASNQITEATLQGIERVVDFFKREADQIDFWVRVAPLPRKARACERCPWWQKLTSPIALGRQERAAPSSNGREETKQARQPEGGYNQPEMPPNTLSTIKVIGGGLSDEATEGEKAIIGAGHPVYRRGATLVRPVIEEVDATRGRRTKVAQLARIDQSYMTDLLCRSAKWIRYDGRQKKWIAINPPAEIAQVILHRFGEWTFDLVAGVISTPTLRADGTLFVRAMRIFCCSYAWRSRPNPWNREKLSL